MRDMDTDYSASTDVFTNTAMVLRERRYGDEDRGCDTHSRRHNLGRNPQLELTNNIPSGAFVPMRAIQLKIMDD